MKKRMILAFSLSLAAGVLFAQTQIYLDADQPIEKRVEDALARMTLEEKVAMTHAQSKFSSPGVARLGIPDVWTSDGPHGIRAEVYWDEWNMAGWTNDSCTAFPALTCLAATWNPKMAALFGKSIGEEARYRNKNILLGPGVNIYRTPLNGRNFEYMGEDPYLASQMVVPYVKGVQSNGVAACVKHFALNNQEVNRGHVNVIVDDRALHEIYLPAFKAAVEQGGAWAIMGSYNRYKGQHCCHNQYLLKDILKGEWHFDGTVLSDWGGTHSTDEAAANGLDMEFGSLTNGLDSGASNAYNSYYLASAYLKGLKEGKYSMDDLNDKVRRILRLIFRTTMAKNRPYGSFASPEHLEAGRKIADEGIVLLKNDRQLLPLDAKTVKSILVVGENAVKRMTIGGGSSSLKVKQEISPLQGIRNRAGAGVKVDYLPGYASPLEAEQDVKGAVRPEQKAIDAVALREEAVKAARNYDRVIFIGGLNKSGGQDCEGTDRKGIGLSYEQDALIEALAKAQPNMAVMLVSGNAVSMPWVKQVPAIVQSWYIGSAAGEAIADILFGDVNPSGKLPFTFPVRLEDNAAKAMGEYPGDRENETYKESIWVGYRWAEKRNIKPLFAFGHGLSYTTFKLGEVKADKKVIGGNEDITLTVNVKNIGNRAGAEVVQLYINDVKSSLPRPAKELKGFQKIFLQPGESGDVTFNINKEMLHFYSDVENAWVVEPGDFKALVGTASDRIQSSVVFTYK